MQHLHLKLIHSALISLILALSACKTITGPPVEIGDWERCKAKQNISLGADCIKQLSQNKREMTGIEFVQWLNAAEGKLPAVCMSGSDAVAELSALEQACTELKNHCSQQLQSMIEAHKLFLGVN